MHAVVGAGLADDLLGFTEMLTKPAPTAICHNFHLIWYKFDEVRKQQEATQASLWTLGLERAFSPGRCKRLSLLTNYWLVVRFNLMINR